MLEYGYKKWLAEKRSHLKNTSCFSLRIGRTFLYDKKLNSEGQGFVPGMETSVKNKLDSLFFTPHL